MLNKCVFLINHGNSLIFVYLFKKRFYLPIHERHRERGRDIGRGRHHEPTKSFLIAMIIILEGIQMLPINHCYLK